MGEGTKRATIGKRQLIGAAWLLLEAVRAELVTTEEGADFPLTMVTYCGSV